jgi:hypothetical protein
MLKRAVCRATDRWNAVLDERRGNESNVGGKPGLGRDYGVPGGKDVRKAPLSVSRTWPRPAGAPVGGRPWVIEV